MSGSKCSYCGAKIEYGKGERVATRGTQSFKIQTFCDKSCADSYFLRIGVDFLILGILVAGAVLIWILR